MAGQEHTNNAVRGGWPRAAFEFPEKCFRFEACFDGSCVQEWVLSHAAVCACDFSQCGVGFCSTESRNQSILQPQKSLFEKPSGKASDSNRAASGDSKAQQD